MIVPLMLYHLELRVAFYKRKMNNTRFNKLWDLLHKSGEVKFADCNESLSLSLVPSRYGYEVSLRSGGSTVLVHYDKERFREILVD